jgi:hypothetical protein
LAEPKNTCVECSETPSDNLMDFLWHGWIIWQSLIESRQIYKCTRKRLECSIQVLMAAHWPPVALRTWPYADIPARYFHLPTILGTEGVCNPSVFCVPSVRRRWQESGLRYFGRFEYNWAWSLREGGILLTPARPTTL